MKMTINEASEAIKDLMLKIELPTDTQLGWLETWVHKKDIEGFQIVIKTLNKYQKIEQILKDGWDKGYQNSETLRRIREVIEDGSN